MRLEWLGTTLGVLLKEQTSGSPDADAAPDRLSRFFCPRPRPGFSPPRGSLGPGLVIPPEEFWVGGPRPYLRPGERRRLSDRLPHRCGRPGARPVPADSARRSVHPG